MLPVANLQRLAVLHAIAMAAQWCAIVISIGIVQARLPLSQLLVQICLLALVTSVTLLWARNRTSVVAMTIAAHRLVDVGVCTGLLDRAGGACAKIVVPRAPLLVAVPDDYAAAG